MFVFYLNPFLVLLFCILTSYFFRHGLAFALMPLNTSAVIVYLVYKLQITRMYQFEFRHNINSTYISDSFRVNL